MRPGFYSSIYPNKWSNMRWNFGGNLKPVRMICEHDWKECPIAVVSYIWSEMVTDVIDGIDGISGETQLWRILAVMLLCSMLLHTVYYKINWLNKSGTEFSREDLIKVGFKMQDLELKINILTYKMQYGTWPMPHEIPTPSYNELRNVKLTLSNTSRQNMWTKHHLHGYISKFIRNSKDMDSDEQNLLSQFGNRNHHFESPMSKERLKLLNTEENNINDYEKLVKTAAECRRYMDEINESNKSLGLFDNSSDTSDRNSVKHISAVTESNKNSHRFLIDPKKWHEIYKCKTKENVEVSESEITGSNQMFSMSNLKHNDLLFNADDEQYPLKSSNKSRLLPPGLSITFLSDKFKRLSSGDKCARQSRNKTLTNETLNKVKEKLESLHDNKHSMKSSKSVGNVDESMGDKTSSEIVKGIKKYNTNSGIVKSLPKITRREDNLSNESDSITSFGIKSTYTRNKDLNSHRQLNLIEQEPFEPNINVVRSRGNIVEDRKMVENNTKMNVTDEIERISKARLSYVLSPENKIVRQTRMDTDEDANLISETSSRTELSKDSDTDYKSTTTLLREALEFKKKLLMQIRRDNEEISEEKGSRNESSECESDDTSISKTDNHFRSKLLDIISEEQSAGSSTEKTSRTYILSRSINETNLVDDSDNYFNENNNVKDLKCGKVILDGECCEDSKSAVAVSSSEYFSTNTVTDNEQAGSQTSNQCIADGDRLREAERSVVRQEDLELNVVKNHEDNNKSRAFDLKLKKYETKEGNEYREEYEEKLNPVLSREYHDIIKKQKINKICVENSRVLNKLENMNKIGESIRETCGDLLDRIEEQVDSVGDKTGTKNESKLKFFRSLSSIDSEKGISWNSISESSSSESIAQFVNALANMESKNIDTTAKQKLLMLNSTDYEGRNFATAGEDLRYSLNPQNRKQNSFVCFSDRSISEQGNSVVEELLGMITVPEILKLNKPETKEQNASARDHSKGSNSFNSKLDQEKLQRKQDIFSKLKTLDAFTKPLDISECNSEKNENEEEPSPLTGRTVVCSCNSKTKNITESFSKAESNVIKNASKSSCIKTSGNTISEALTYDDKLSKEKCRQLFSETEINESKDLESNKTGLDAKTDSLKCCGNSENKTMTSNTKRNQLSKSSITNFSTDTSDSYFDVSNHDFAVSSVILTSQNSNFVSNHKDDVAKSDTSSSYIDASDWSKLPSNSSLTESNPTTNLAEKKNHLAESRTVQANTSDTEVIKPLDTELLIKDVRVQNNLESKHESLTKTQLIPKCTSSSPSNDKKCELDGQLCIQKSSGDLNQQALKCGSRFKLERSNSKSKSTSRSCIPVLKSRIEVPRRDKSMEAKARSRSPVHRLNTPRIEGAESNCRMVRTVSGINEKEKGIRQSIYGSRRSLNSKQSYTLPSKNSDNNQECPNAKPNSMENKEGEIVGSVSSQSTGIPNIVDNSGQLTKECTVIYINIISDSDRNENPSVDPKELIKYVNETDFISGDNKSDSKCQNLSLRSLKSDRSDEINQASYTSDSKLCKNENENASTVIKTSLEAERKDSAHANESDEILKPSVESITTTANKLLSTSTLEVSNTVKIERREIEVSAKPSIKTTSTSVSDFPDASPGEKRSFYNFEKEVFDVSKNVIQKEQIVLSEMLATDPNFFECRKTHRLYNKLGLGVQDQTEEL